MIFWIITVGWKLKVGSVSLKLRPKQQNFQIEVANAWCCFDIEFFGQLMEKESLQNEDPTSTSWVQPKNCIIEIFLNLSKLDGSHLKSFREKGKLQEGGGYVEHGALLFGSKLKSGG